jgi:hypothetical protein
MQQYQLYASLMHREDSAHAKEGIIIKNMMIVNDYFQSWPK